MGDNGGADVCDDDDDGGDDNGVDKDVVEDYDSVGDDYTEANGE